VGHTVVAEFEAAITALQRSGDLVEWIEPRSVAERLGATLTAAALQWATGDLSDGELERTAVLGTCLLLLGACRGSAHAAVEAEARRHESRRARQRRRASKTEAPR
jgi:hypothetical protein